MRDPFSWSFPIGRLFGITIRIHFLFPLVAVGLVLREAFNKQAIPGTWQDAAMLMGLLFGMVLAHEFGHCFAARWVYGDANEVLLWPLGGLASVDVPHTARANFITAAGGPAVNLLICIGCAIGLLFCLDASYRPPLNPFWYPYRIVERSQIFLGQLTTWDGTEVSTNNMAAVIMARLFYVTWINFLMNVCLIGFPLDGGRMFQCILWPYVGYRQATLYAVYAGFVTMFLVLFFAFVINDVLPLCLAAFIYVSCKSQWLAIETGGEESLFGYDFSQGYTSLERDQAQPAAPPRRKRPNFFQRWLQRRAERKRQKELETKEADDRRMDELLEKIARSGKGSLTDEEHRFMKRVADRYRNRP